MPALIFDTCCGCIDLKTGCLIIGYLQLVGEILLGAFIPRARPLLVVGGVSLASGDEEWQAIRAVFLNMRVIFFLMLALLLTFTITLLVGLHKNKRFLVKAYLICSTIFLVLFNILIFVSVSRIEIAITENNIIIPNKSSIVFFHLVVMAICAYLLLVVHSHYHKMDDANQGAIYNTA